MAKDNAVEEELMSPAEATDYDVASGLADYYAAMANILLTQYQTIETLLGPTRDWTGPGTYCEILLRDVLRRSLPSRFSVDKGFVHGRRKIEGNDVHCPEIDILIHDTHVFRPIFRMDDFVIVQPEAVMGVIQVKRTMNSSALEKAIANVVLAKRHIHMCGRKPIDVSNVYSAVVAFGDDISDLKDGSTSSVYKTYLGRWATSVDDRVYMPNFVGSLTSRFCGLNPKSTVNRISYSLYHSDHEGRKIAVQVLLASMTRRLIHPDHFPPFGISKGIPAREALMVWEAN